MNFPLWYFTLSYVMWDLLESVCKLQDIYYTCKAYLILFRHIFFCFINQYKQNAILRWDEFHFVISYMTQTGHFFVMHVINCVHMKMLSSFNGGCEEFLVFLELKMVYKDMLYKCNTCLEAYKHFLRSLTWHRKA